MAVGKFVISLDLELFWGVRDKRTITSYGENVKNEHIVIPKMLKLFEQYDIHVTWATVGFLLCTNKQELIKFIPKTKPLYVDANLSPYTGYIDSIGNDQNADPYHYASNLIDLIVQHKNQELATHTFSHYYCLEPGQTVDQFRSDIQAAINVAKSKNNNTYSIIFPRNQYLNQYLEACSNLGIKVFRGTEQHWAYDSHNGSENTRIKRMFRLVDSYLNLSGNHAFLLEHIAGMINLPASRFLRPYSNKLNFLEPLKLRRIFRSMQSAAKENKIYHLWWHPHNFGNNIEQNIAQLELILKKYTELNLKYGMQSQNMGEFSGQ